MTKQITRYPQYIADLLQTQATRIKLVAGSSALTTEMGEGTPVFTSV